MSLAKQAELGRGQMQEWVQASANSAACTFQLLLWWQILEADNWDFKVSSSFESFKNILSIGLCIPSTACQQGALSPVWAESCAPGTIFSELWSRALCRGAEAGFLLRSLGKDGLRDRVGFCHGSISSWNVQQSSLFRWQFMRVCLCFFPPIFYYKKSKHIEKLNNRVDILTFAIFALSFFFT